MNDNNDRVLAVRFERRRDDGFEERIEGVTINMRLPVELRRDEALNRAQLSQSFIPNSSYKLKHTER